VANSGSAASTSQLSHDVFISYSRKDEAFAALLEAALESFRPPKGAGIPPKSLEVFRDRNDFTGNDYREAVRKHLANSRLLLVICSPNARRSDFVNEEIQEFAALRGPSSITLVLFGGKPNNEVGNDSDEAAFGPALTKLFAIPNGADFRGFDPARHRIGRAPFGGPFYTVLADLHGADRARIEDRDRKRARKRLLWLRGGIAAAAVTVTGTVGWSVWTRTDAYQGRHSLSEGLLLAQQIKEGVPYAWISALAAQGRVDDVLRYDREDLAYWDRIDLLKRAIEVSLSLNRPQDAKTYLERLSALYLAGASPEPIAIDLALAQGRRDLALAMLAHALKHIDPERSFGERFGALGTLAAAAVELNATKELVATAESTLDTNHARQIALLAVEAALRKEDSVGASAAMRLATALGRKLEEVSQNRGDQQQISDSGVAGRLILLCARHNLDNDCDAAAGGIVEIWGIDMPVYRDGIRALAAAGRLEEAGRLSRRMQSGAARAGGYPSTALLEVQALTAEAEGRYAAGDVSGANTAFDAATKSATSDAEAIDTMLLMANVAHRLGRKPDSLQWAQKAAAKTDLPVGDRLRVLRALAQAGDTEGSRSVASKVPELPPPGKGEFPSFRPAPVSKGMNGRTFINIEGMAPHELDDGAREERVMLAEDLHRLGYRELALAIARGAAMAGDQKPFTAILKQRLQESETTLVPFLQEVFEYQTLFSGDDQTLASLAEALRERQGTTDQDGAALVRNAVAPVIALLASEPKGDGITETSTSITVAGCKLLWALGLTREAETVQLDALTRISGATPPSKDDAVAILEVVPGAPADAASNVVSNRADYSRLQETLTAFTAALEAEPEGAARAAEWLLALLRNGHSAIARQSVERLHARWQANRYADLNGEGWAMMVCAAGFAGQHVIARQMSDDAPVALRLVSYSFVLSGLAAAQEPTKTATPDLLCRMSFGFY